MTKFIDYEEEEANWKMKKEAGKSAFDGVKSSEGKITSVTEFANNYINKLIGNKRK